MAITNRTTVTSNGTASPLSGVYYPKPSYADEPYFQEIDGYMHFLIQPWMKTVSFDDGVYSWDTNSDLLQDVYIAPPLDTAAGWNVGDKITLKFMLDFAEQATDVVNFGFLGEDVEMDNITIGAEDTFPVHTQFDTNDGYAVFEYHPLLSNDGSSAGNTFEFHKVAQQTSGLGADADISSVLLKSYVWANVGVDIYDIVYPY